MYVYTFPPHFLIVIIGGRNNPKFCDFLMIRDGSSKIRLCEPWVYVLQKCACHRLGSTGVLSTAGWGNFGNAIENSGKSLQNRVFRETPGNVSFKGWTKACLMVVQGSAWVKQNQEMETENLRWHLDGCVSCLSQRRDSVSDGANLRQALLWLKFEGTVMGKSWQQELGPPLRKQVGKSACAGWVTFSLYSIQDSSTL